ncbi:MAG: hypothetical protein V4736_06165 [Bdellovibrionota bacterium]
MKTVVMILTMIFSAVSFAKVSDFNKMIVENIETQAALHQEVKTKVIVPVEAAPAQDPRFVDVERKNLISPTEKDFLRHKKELTQYRASEKVQRERVAHEFESNSEF